MAPRWRCSCRRRAGRCEWDGEGGSRTHFLALRAVGSARDGRVRIDLSPHGATVACAPSGLRAGRCRHDMVAMVTETAHVLVVEDDATVREVVVRYLEREGIDVAAVGDGESALAQADAHWPDLVVLD